MSSKRLQDKVALITGAASGLGREIALNYASHGTKLIVVADLQAAPKFDASHKEDDEQVVDRINRLYGEGRAVFVKCDVTSAEDVKAAVREAVEKGGRLDIMVNNAGIIASSPVVPFHETDDDEWEKVLSINLKGVYLGSKHALAQMSVQELDSAGKRGRVLNVASIFGFLAPLGGGSRAGAYSASKGAVLNLSRSLANEYASKGINVNALCPGFLRTAFNNQHFDDPGLNALLGMRGGWGEPSDVACAASFLVSEEANWIHGIGLPVDGGYMAS